MQNTLPISTAVGFYEVIAKYPAFQSGDECINENGSLLIGIPCDADRDAPPFKAGRVHFYLGVKLGS